MAYIPERIMSRFLPCYAYPTSYIKLLKYSKIWWFDKSGDVGYLYIYIYLFMRWDVNMSYSKHINITILDTSHPHDKLCPPIPISMLRPNSTPTRLPIFRDLFQVHDLLGLCGDVILPIPWRPRAVMRRSRGTVPSGRGGRSWGSPNHWIVWPVGSGRPPLNCRDLWCTSTLPLSPFWIHVVSKTS